MNNRIVRLALLVALTSMFLGLSSSMAEEAAGTIRSVDAKSRTVVLRVEKDKALELTVSRKAKITIDGKEGAIEALRSGQKATVSYSADTEVATEIRGSTEPNAEDEGTTDVKWLQGEWIAINMRISNKVESKDDLQRINMRLLIVGNKLRMESVQGRVLTTLDGRFELDSLTDPKRIDWSGKRTAGDMPAHPLAWEGIYQIDKDLNQFTLCRSLNKKRPESFDAWKEKDTAIFIIFNRD